MECPRRGLRRGRLVLGGRPPTLDLIENPLYDARRSSASAPAPISGSTSAGVDGRRAPRQADRRMHASSQLYAPATAVTPPRPNYASRSSSAPSSVSSAVASVPAAGAMEDDVDVQRRPKLSRSETIKRYVRKSTASFFGLDEESAPESCQRWTLRRKRLLSKRYGEIKVRSSWLTRHSVM